MIQSMCFAYKGNHYSFNPQKPIDISLPISPGEDNVNCYFAEAVTFETIRQGDFVGSVAEGGPCNYQKISLTPHGNGTHTECYGHVSADPEATLFNCLHQFLFFAQLISIQPRNKAQNEVVTFDDFTSRLDPDFLPEAVVLRTRPNTEEKRKKKYSGTNPPYLQSAIGAFLARHDVQHLLVDLPSVDPEVDGGRLDMHKQFWQFPETTRRHATISELVYIADDVPDGFYLLNLQVSSLQSDASPSKPLLYGLDQV